LSVRFFYNSFLLASQKAKTKTKVRMGRKVNRAKRESKRMGDIK